MQAQQNTPADKDRIPTRAEQIKFLKDNIEIMSLQAKLQEHRAHLAIYRLEEIKALNNLAHLKLQQDDMQAAADAKNNQPTEDKENSAE